MNVYTVDSQFDLYIYLLHFSHVSFMHCRKQDGALYIKTVSVKNNI